MASAASLVTRLSQDDAAIDSIERAGALAVEALRSGGKILACGNGGSMSDAMHFAEELSGRFRMDRPALAAIAISDPAHLSCTANDFGYDHVFSRFIEALGRPGDLLVAISTSGQSANVIQAAQAAQKGGLAVVALTGRAETPLHHICTVAISTPGDSFPDRIQEQHALVLHTLVEVVERHLFPALYEPS
jgi:D-sedoheptulose 7-phosphate isomerase